MKLSRFNVSKEYEEGTYWVYNTFTTAAVVVNKETYLKYFVTENFFDDNLVSQQLYEMGFAIDDDFDELAYLQSLRKKVVYSNKKIADIMIAPTMDCNARCYYCFEHGCHHEKMTIETADAVVQYIKENWNGDLFNISWFGGEPLLATDIMDYISNKLKLENINFISRITTNGYELTDDVINKALRLWHTNKIQVSIDAMFEEYDRIKNYKCVTEKGAFQRVIQNVESALLAGLSVRIRINFNPNEKEKAENLLRYLQSKFSHFSHFSSYFAPIDADSNIVPSVASSFSGMKKHPFLHLIEFGQKYGYYCGNKRGTQKNFAFDETGLLSDLKLYPSPTNCYASCPSVFAIDSKGDLYKCHRVLGKGRQYSSGNVKTGIIQNEIYKFFCNTDVAFKECNKCKLLPVCQGGCKINAYIYNDEHACSPIKNIYPELIEMYLKRTRAI